MDTTPASDGGPRTGAAVPAHGRGLAELILAEAKRSGLRAGSRLATERRLAAELSVTRSSVRHALAILQAEGRISREVGRGTFFRTAPDPLDVVAGGAADGSPLQDSTPRPGATGGQDYAPADVM